MSQRRSQKRLKLRGSTGRAVAGGEDQVRRLPGRAGGVPGGGLRGAAASSSATVQMSGSGRVASEAAVFVSRCSSSAPTRWSCRSIGQLPRVEVDVSPGEPQHLALAQTEHQDQDVRGVERVVVGAGRLQEAPRLVARPRLPLALAYRRQLHQGRDVAGDQPFGDRLGQQRPEHGPEVA